MPSPKKRNPAGGAGPPNETTKGLGGLGMAVYSPPECLVSRKRVGLGSNLPSRMDMLTPAIVNAGFRVLGTEIVSPSRTYVGAAEQQD
jgi:hypothetical protein